MGSLVSRTQSRKRAFFRFSEYSSPNLRGFQLPETASAAMAVFYLDGAKSARYPSAAPAMKTPHRLCGARLSLPLPMTFNPSPQTTPGDATPRQPSEGTAALNYGSRQASNPLYLTTFIFPSRTLTFLSYDRRNSTTVCLKKDSPRSSSLTRFNYICPATAHRYL